MVTNNVFYSHCKLENYYNKIRILESRGWTVHDDDVFKNFSGEKFIRFSYFKDPNNPKVAHVLTKDLVHKRVEKLIQENIHQG